MISAAFVIILVFQLTGGKSDSDYKGSPSQAGGEEYEGVPIADDGDCPRYRKAWHLISDEERQLYLDGILALRNTNHLAYDKIVQLANVHATVDIILFHQTSFGEFWHGYLVWELESAIRTLGGRFRCFGMPYYDFTIDYGRESSPSILDSILGGTGDPDNGYSVNGYSWDVSVEGWFVANEASCVAETDRFPMCSLKRKPAPSSLDGKLLLSAEQLLPFFTDDKHANFGDFNRLMTVHQSMLIFLVGYDKSDSSALLESGTVMAHQGSEPIWWLYHSFTQYMMSMWISCRGHAGEVLEDNTDAYTGYCGGPDTLLEDAPNRDCDSDILRERLGDRFADAMLDRSVDAELDTAGLKETQPWTFAYNHKLTVRKLYDISDWNVVYDTGSFWRRSGLSEQCELNDVWFRQSRPTEEVEAVEDANVLMPPQTLLSHPLIGLISLCVFVALAVWTLYKRCSSKDKSPAPAPDAAHDYGSIGKLITSV